ncbi:MAG TPA: hypothetical protein VN737_08955 [Bryobacteraceae bacterium]|nr:hypothetical protein [Bryobacteraceae bacterium]
MKKLLVFLAVALPLCARDKVQLEHDLDQIAKVATVMVDGDVCQRILTPRALQHILRKDPRDQWADGDNYDVDDQAFITTKKTLMRLAQLANYPVDVNLWMPLDGAPGRIHVVIRNRYEMSQFWKWGDLTQPTPPIMQKVLEFGQRVGVEQKSGYVSVLAPVRNSLNNIVGLVEVVSEIRPNARENVK